MTQQYGIINQCLQLIKQCDVPELEKVHIETQLIRMKTLLIKTAMLNKAEPRSHGLEVFEELLFEMQSVCCVSHQRDALDGLMKRIDRMLVDIGRA